MGAPATGVETCAVPLASFSVSMQKTGHGEDGREWSAKVCASGLTSTTTKKRGCLGMRRGGGDPCIFYGHGLVSFTHPCYRSRENLLPIAPLYHLRAIDLCHLRVLVTDRVNTCNTYARLVSYPRTCCSSKQQQSVHKTAQYRITAHFKAKVCTPLNATISMEYITLRFVMTKSPCNWFESAPFSVYSFLSHSHLPN